MTMEVPEVITYTEDQVQSLMAGLFAFMYDALVPNSWYKGANLKSKKRPEFLSRAQKAASLVRSGLIRRVDATKTHVAFLVPSANKADRKHRVFIGRGAWLRDGNFQCGCEESFRDENFPCYHVLAGAMECITESVELAMNKEAKEAEAVAIFDIYASMMDGSPIEVQ